MVNDIACVIAKARFRQRLSTWSLQSFSDDTRYYPLSFLALRLFKREFELSMTSYNYSRKAKKDLKDSIVCVIGKVL